MCLLSFVSQFATLSCVSCSRPLLFELSELMDASTVGFSNCTVHGFWASECKSLLRFLYHPLTPHVLLDLHSLKEWNPSKNQKQNLSFCRFHIVLLQLMTWTCCISILSNEFCFSEDILFYCLNCLHWGVALKLLLLEHWSAVSCTKAILLSQILK